MKKIIGLVLLILCMGSMYYFSSQDGTKSSSQSGKAVQVIDNVRDKVTLNDSRLISVKEKVFDKLKQYGDKGYIVRKIAHFSIYACIGISMAYIIYLFSKKVFISSTLAFMLSIMYAYYDEYRQLSVVGRVGSIKDVFIDSSGALTGILIFCILTIGLNGIKSLIFKNRGYND